jgi:hypothetical protein
VTVAGKRPATEGQPCKVHCKDGREPTALQ